jgi:hypothetical protein
LLHFIVLGGALFAIDHVVDSQRDDPRRIVYTSESDKEIRALFKASSGREPRAAEARALRQAWLDNEVLYREGLALQVDKGDPTIRDRVIFKALSVIDADVQRPPVDDAVLRSWFESYRAKYDEPPRFDFQEAVPAGERSEVVIAALVEQLNRGGGGEIDASLRVFKGRPRANLDDSYGEAFTRGLSAAPQGQWRSLLGRDGWRAVRLDGVSAGRPARFEVVRPLVLQDWTDQAMAEQRTAAVRTLAKKYTVVNEGIAP